MGPSREMKLLQKAKCKAQSNNNLKEEASICNQLGELLSRSGDYVAAIQEHQQELALSEVLNDVIGRAVANRRIGECYAEMGNIDAALKHQRCHLDLARSVRDHAEEQRALATIGRTFLFCYETDQSKNSLEQAGDAFRKSLDIVNERLEGTVPRQEINEMKARLFLNLGLVCDHLGEAKRCSEFIRRSVFIAEKGQLLEDLYRANFNLGIICFRNGRHSNAVRCLEQAKECARKIKDKFCESECFHSIGKVQLSLGDLVAARRALKKALRLGSQQLLDRQAVKKSFKYADQGCKLEEELGKDQDNSCHRAVELAEQLGDLYCKVGCYSKALDAYQAQLKAAEALDKPARELAVIHVSLAATYTDLRQHNKAVEHYKNELALRQGNVTEECSTWLNIAMAQEESGSTFDDVDSSYNTALCCAQTSGQAQLQKRVLRLWLAFQKRSGSSNANNTQARLQLCTSEGWSPDGSDGEGEEEEEEEEEEIENSETLDDSDVILSDSDEDLEGYDKMVTGRRKTGRWNKRNEKGETLLHRACIDGNLKQVQYLVERGHAVNPRDYCGWTPLHEACNHDHQEIVAVLLERGANINDPGGPLCEGITPLHDALACGNFKVARLLVEQGASVMLRNSKGERALDALHRWQRTYRRELDQDTRQECSATERLLRRALAGPAPAWLLDAPQHSPLFDAENFDLPSSTGGDGSSSRDWLRNRLSSEGKAGVNSPEEHQTKDSTHRHGSRGAEAPVLYGMDSDSDGAISPLRAVRPRHSLTAVPRQMEAPALEEPGMAPSLGQDSVREAPQEFAFAPEEYHSAIRNLGSAKTVLQGRSQPSLSSTPVVLAISKSPLIPEEDYVADDWLEDDLAEMQPQKKRRLQVEQHKPRKEQTALSSLARSENKYLNSDTACRVLPSTSRGLSLKKNGSLKPQQAKMTQMPGMVRLGPREVSRSHSPSLPEDDELEFGAPSSPQIVHFQPSQQLVAPSPTSVALPIRIRVRVQEDVFLIPVPQSEANSCTVWWLCEQAAQRYYQRCGLLPRLSLQKEGALLSPQDLLLTVLHTNEEVRAEVCSWDLPPFPERYKKACQSLAVDANQRVTRLCEVQDGSSCVSVCGLSLGPGSLTPLLRALKLQASLTELHLSGNRMLDSCLPDLMAATVTMPRLRLLNLSANCITREGLEMATNALKGQTHPGFPYLEELDLSMNPLGDGGCASLACLLSCCPLLVRLSLQACGLTARFLLQHRLLLATALTGTGHLRSICLSHNALGSTGFELVLKTLPLHCLTHLDLSAVHRGPTDPLGLEHFVKVVSQVECSLTDLSLAANSLTDSSIATLVRCFSSCPKLVRLNVSGNPSVTSAGLRSILRAVRETRQPLTQLKLQGCQVSGPWSNESLGDLSQLVQDLHLCSEGLNKLDRQALKQSWDRSGTRAYLLNRKAKFLLSAAASSEEAHKER